MERWANFSVGPGPGTFGWLRSVVRKRLRSGPEANRANAVWMLLGTGLYSAARAMVVIIIAKLSSKELSQTLVGQYGWAFAFCIPTVMFCRFALRTLQATDARNEIRFNEFFCFALLSTSLGLAIVAGMTVVNGPDRGTAALIALVALWNSIESLSELYSGLFQRYERIDIIAAAYFLQAVLMCLLMALGFGLTHNLLWGVGGLVVASVIRLACFEMPWAARLISAHAPAGVAGDPGLRIWQTLRPQWSWPAVRRLLAMGTPLTTVLAIIAFTTSVPRYILKDDLGEARLGVYVALLSLASAQNLIVGAVAQSMYSRLAILYVQQQRATLLRLTLKTITLSLAVGLPGIVIAAVAGKLILSLIYTPAYAADVDVFVILMLAAMIDGIGQVLGTAITSMRRFVVQVPVHVVRLAIIYFGCVWAVPRFGLPGVAWVVVVANVVGILCFAGLCWWGFRQIDRAIGGMAPN
ncbi:MAG TPA: hypothetical protein VMJ32_17135 [Pirellulales bacterium]|nr:hypothetical protein [Pirellulales bacterium]